MSILFIVSEMSFTDVDLRVEWILFRIDNRVFGWGN